MGLAVWLVWPLSGLDVQMHRRRAVGIYRAGLPMLPPPLPLLLKSPGAGLPWLDRDAVFLGNRWVERWGVDPVSVDGFQPTDRASICPVLQGLPFTHGFYL